MVVSALTIDRLTCHWLAQPLVAWVHVPLSYATVYISRLLLELHGLPLPTISDAFLNQDTKPGPPRANWYWLKHILHSVLLPRLAFCFPGRWFTDCRGFHKTWIFKNSFCKLHVCVRKGVGLWLYSCIIGWTQVIFMYYGQHSCVVTEVFMSYWNFEHTHKM